MEGNGQGAEDDAGTCVTSVLDPSLDGIVSIGDVIVSINGFKCLSPISSEVVRIQLANASRPISILLHPTVHSRNTITMNAEQAKEGALNEQEKERAKQGEATPDQEGVYSITIQRDRYEKL